MTAPSADPLPCDLPEKEAARILAGSFPRVAQLGSGGIGTVFRAEEPDPGRAVAIEEPTPSGVRTASEV